MHRTCLFLSEQGQWMVSIEDFLKEIYLCMYLAVMGLCCHVQAFSKLQREGAIL